MKQTHLLVGNAPPDAPASTDHSKEDASASKFRWLRWCV